MNIKMKKKNLFILIKNVILLNNNILIMINLK